MPTPPDRRQCRPPEPEPQSEAQEVNQVIETMIVMAGAVTISYFLIRAMKKRESK
jgi:hypothetical protein